MIGEKSDVLQSRAALAEDISTASYEAANRFADSDMASIGNMIADAVGRMNEETGFNPNIFDRKDRLGIIFAAARYGLWSAAKAGSSEIAAIMSCIDIEAAEFHGKVEPRIAAKYGRDLLSSMAGVQYGQQPLLAPEPTGLPSVYPEIDGDLMEMPGLDTAARRLQ